MDPILLLDALLGVLRSDDWSGKHNKSPIRIADSLCGHPGETFDLFWLRGESLEGAGALPSPDVLAASIVEDLQTALEQFVAIAEDLGGCMK